MKDSSFKEIGSRITQLRREKSLTQAEFAGKIHCDRSLVTKLETGKVNLSPLIRLAITNIFGVRREWLETGQGDQYDNRWSILEARAKDLGDAIYIELSTLKAYKKAYQEVVDKDPKLAHIIEKLRFIFDKGGVKDKAAVRGIIEEVYDMVQEDLEKAAKEEAAKKGAS